MNEPKGLHARLVDLTLEPDDQMDDLLGELGGEVTDKTVDARFSVFDAVADPPSEFLDPPVGRSKITDQFVVGD
jgi:hypothetical protein